MAKLEPDACMPCRGTGRVISNLGGESQQVVCPWCQGSGTRQTGVDAQATWLEVDAAGGGAAESGASEGESEAAEGESEASPSDAVA